jgi:heat-inducible transcriptional repressor
VTDHAELDERKASILRAIVEEYVETAQPVGSQTVARSSGLGVSSATIRNDMTILEREGFIAQPHTSAGRVPTDRGYRFFVDHFTGQGPLPASQHRAVADFFATTHRALEDLLNETSQLLSRVSKHAAMVVGPPPDQAEIRTVQLVRLHERTVLLVVVLSNGAIERHVLNLAADVDDGRLAAAAARLDAAFAGGTWGAVPDVIATNEPEIDAIVADARTALLQLSAPEHREPLYLGGVSKLAAEQEAFSTAESAARLLEMLEHQVIVVSLVHELLEAGLTVRIGAENQLDELRECALVLAPYQVDGQAAGIVGVLGPTRMNYRHALAAVSAVSQQLGRHLS